MKLRFMNKLKPEKWIGKKNVMAFAFEKKVKWKLPFPLFIGTASFKR